jgi:hypothetical protein
MLELEGTWYWSCTRKLGALSRELEKLELDRLVAWETLHAGVLYPEDA